MSIGASAATVLNQSELPTCSIGGIIELCAVEYRVQSEIMPSAFQLLSRMASFHFLVSNPKILRFCL